MRQGHTARHTGNSPATDMSASLELAPPEIAYVAAFLARLRSWDERAAVRLQVRGQLLGLYGSLPMDALAIVVVPLTSPGGDVDVTVSAGRMRDILGDTNSLFAVGGEGSRSVRLPDPILGPQSLATLPPRSGWAPGQVGLAAGVADLVDAAVAAFRVLVPAGGSPASDLAASAAWDSPGWGGVPMRGLHAASLLGFLARPEVQVRTSVAPGWCRLVTPAGQVAVATGSSVSRLTLVPSRR
jgi:hypothetical protein